MYRDKEKVTKIRTTTESKDKQELQVFRQNAAKQMKRKAVPISSDNKETFSKHTRSMIHPQLGLECTMGVMGAVLWPLQWRWAWYFPVPTPKLDAP